MWYERSDVARVSIDVARVSIRDVARMRTNVKKTFILKKDKTCAAQFKKQPASGGRSWTTLMVAVGMLGHARKRRRALLLLLESSDSSESEQ
jgi:hypothetical protein